MAKKNTGSEITEKFSNINLKKSIITFLSVFIVFYSLSFLFDSFYSKTLTNIGQNYYDKNINSETKYKRNVKLINPQSKPNIAEARITYYDKRDKNGKFIVKTIGTDLRRESLISVILLTSLVFAFPSGFKKNIINYIITLILLYIFIFFKLYVFVYDNYNYPDYSLIELSGIKSFFVYWGTYFFNVTGASTNVIVPVILWFLVNIKIFRK